MPTIGAANIWEHFIFTVKINMKLRQKNSVEKMHSLVD